MDPCRPDPADAFDELVSALRVSLTPLSTPPSASASPMALPSAYSGEAVECSGFLLQISLYIEMQPQKFATERAKVAFLLLLLSGCALLWAHAIWNSQSTIINSFDAFVAHFKEVCGQSTGSLSIPDQLIRLRQGRSTVSDYTLQFCTLAATNGWNEAALLTAYRQGLDSQIRMQMAIYDDSMGLENFMLLAGQISQLITACHSDDIALPPAGYPGPEPMQMDATRLTSMERARRLSSGLCLYCGSSGHFI